MLSRIGAVGHIVLGALVPVGMGLVFLVFLVKCLTWVIGAAWTSLSQSYRSPRFFIAAQGECFQPWKLPRAGTGMNCPGNASPCSEHLGVWGAGTAAQELLKAPSRALYLLCFCCPWWSQFLQGIGGLSLATGGGCEPAPALPKLRMRSSGSFSFGGW